MAETVSEQSSAFLTALPLESGSRTSCKATKIKNLMIHGLRWKHLNSKLFYKPWLYNLK